MLVPCYVIPLRCKWNMSVACSVPRRIMTRLDSVTSSSGIRTEGFDFLGYHFRGSLRLPRKKSLHKVKDTIRAKTHRANGHSLLCIAASLTTTLRGWFTYFRHCHWTVFADVDGWTRGRLRSILRKRRGRRGRGRGTDHQRWPNAFFAEQGLYSLSVAHVRFGQSPLG